MLNSTSIDNIVSLFKTKTEDMPKIYPNGEYPTHTTLRLFQDAINANAMAIPSPTNKLGHLGLVIGTEEYKNASPDGAEHITPTKPSDKPEEPTRQSGPSSVFNAQEALREWTAQVHTYNVHNAVENALRNQILNSVDEEFISDLEHPTTKFLCVTPLAILTHLWANFGQIDARDLQKKRGKNENTMEPPHPNLPSVETTHRRPNFRG